MFQPTGERKEERTEHAPQNHTREARQQPNVPGITPTDLSKNGHHTHDGGDFAYCFHVVYSSI
ncbi:hypothetical protein [Butyricicoccus pullicaecorum]|uniref:hypothetical protein n=1 Tax=Butyricicoccus pullicaecorum TaxID=501571 RepID=UPI0013A65627|nr:hypothetical protein [Butyricicoccus pullicaecorum]